MIDELVRRLTLLERRVDDLIRPENSRWMDWTPVITQSLGVTYNKTFARYVIIGDTVHLEARLAITGGAAVAGNAIEITGMPASITPTANHSGSITTVGTCSILDSGTAAYFGFTVHQLVTSIRFIDSATQGTMGVNPNFALANGDVVAFRATYERA